MLGCTRVQLGVQHTDDGVLRHINRGCTTADTVRAMRLLKDAAFKIDFHLMPDLPGK
jgi:histone acetyltransferase (RNA polymerase elongator complex component)